MKLVKTWLCIQVTQTNLKDQLHISTESPKEGFFNDTVLTLVPVFLCSCSILVVMLPFRTIFLTTCISFSRESAIV